MQQKKSIYLGDTISYKEGEWVSYFICEDDCYRTKTEEELKNDLDKSEQEYQKRVEMTVNKVWMPIINVLNNEKVPIGIYGIFSILDEIGAKNRFGDVWTTYSLKPCLEFMEKVGLVACVEDKYYSIKMSEDETKKKLIEAVEASKYIILNSWMKSFE